MIDIESHRNSRGPSGSLLVLLVFFCSLTGLHAQDEGGPVDSVGIFNSIGSEPYECCHTLQVFNRQPDSVPIREVRVVLLGVEGEFIVGDSRAPSGWSVFDQERRITWISGSTEADLDSGESLTSFRFCVRDTGIYRFRWETHGPDGLLSADTLTFACGSRDNCDDIFFRPVPSSRACGFDVDFIVENGAQQIVNRLYLDLVTTGISFDTSGHRVPNGWELRAASDRTLEFRATGGGSSFGQFVEGFRFFVDAPAQSPIRIRWRTANFSDEICRDMHDVVCGISVPDTLFSRRLPDADSCCRDFLLINTHRRASNLEGFRLVTTRTGITIEDGATAPEGWSVLRSAGGDTLLFMPPDSGMQVGDSALFAGVCFENDPAAVDSVLYRWETLFEGYVVTEGNASFACRRDVLFCDSIDVLVDSSLSSADRRIDITLRNTNSRRDDIRKFVVRVDNPGVRRRILDATAPQAWSIDVRSDDSVVFHRGVLQAGREQDGFVLFLSEDTGAADPIRLTYTTYIDEIRPICTDSIDTDLRLDRTCDSVMLAENDNSISPLCCFDLTLKNRNAKSLPIDRLEIRLPRTDLFFDTATAAVGSWQVSTAFFPSVSVDYVGDTLRQGEEVTLSFCVNAIVEPDRPITFDVVWRTFSGGQQICRDTVVAECDGAPGRCDSIANITGDTAGCPGWYSITNLHTPTGPVDNIEITMLTPGRSFLEAETSGNADRFDQIDLSTGSVLFRGGAIAPEEEVGTFIVRFGGGDPGDTAVVRVCTFEGDTELCCEVDTLFCATTSVENRERGLLTHEIRPNPATTGRTVLAIEMVRAGTVEIEIVDAEGRRVRQMVRRLGAGSTNVPLDLYDLPSGSYVYRLHVDGRTVVGKVVR